MAQKSYKRIKNFSTIVSVENTIGTIEKILAQHGAQEIAKKYNGAGQPVFMAFTIKTEHGSMPIKLPANVERVLVKFQSQVDEGKLPGKYYEGEWAEAQAARVAWRIIKDWLDAQLWLLDIGLAKVEEIFLPYFYNPIEQKTMFQIIEEKGFNLLALPEGNE